MRNVTFVRTLFGLLALACMAAGAAYRHGTEPRSKARNAPTTTTAPVNTNARALHLERSVNRMSPRQTLHNVLSK